MIVYVTFFLLELDVTKKSNVTFDEPNFWAEPLLKSWLKNIKSELGCMGFFKVLLVLMGFVSVFISIKESTEGKEEAGNS